MLSVTQQLLKGHRFSYNVQNISLAETQWGLSELSYQQSHQQILSDVASAYWNWVYQEALTSIASDAVVVAEEALRVGEAKVEAGELAPVEETRLRAAYVQSQTSALDAQNGVYQAGDSLLLLMGLPSGESIAPATLVGDVVQMSIEIGSAVAVALAQNYDIRILRMNVDSSEQNLQNARHGMLPSLSATATTGLRSQYENEGETVRALAGLNDNSYPWAAISSNLSMPLGNRSSRSSLDTARSELAMRRQELANTERLVRSQVEEQVRTLTSSQERVRLADAQLALAQETLAGEESLVEAGRKIHKDLLEARNQLASAQGEAVKARIDSRIAQVQLLKLQGQLQID
jgi:outer membrane protein TolC